MKATRRIFSRGKVTIPATIRNVYELEDGDLVEIIVHPVEEDRDD
jgi:bifunctional DNA-binding transcriptional regulator/antitoxin component of YhaV-PrlF toxin-antitoxin module